MFCLALAGLLVGVMSLCAAYIRRVFNEGQAPRPLPENPSKS